MSLKKPFGKSLFTNFDGTNVPEDFQFPSIEIEDIDRAVFDFFDKELSFETEEKGKSRKVPVVFASGERFALTRRENPIRDNNNALILPLISITRGDMDISISQHGLGTAIAFADQPGYYIKKRLAKEDRGYQNIINKQGLKNQKNVAARSNFQDSEISPGNFAKLNTVASRRNGKGLSFYANKKGISLKENLGKNIFEIIEVPYPKFIAIKYEAVFWAQYITQANELLQTVFRAFKGQYHETVIKTQSGYEMLMKFGNNFSIDNNFDSFTDDERLIKHNLGLTVAGYMINPKNIKGIPNQIRSYYSAPNIDFSYNSADTKVVINNQVTKGSDVVNKNILTDLKNIKEIKGRKEETTEDLELFVVNPFTNDREVKFSKVLASNKRKGESVVSKLVTKKIDRQFE